MKQFHINRLWKLTKHLMKVKKREFNLGTWKSERECGTTACACGHACSIRSFRRAGLHLIPAGWGDFVLRYRGFRSFDAAAEFFELSEHEAEFLFSPSRYEEYQL